MGDDATSGQSSQQQDALTAWQAQEFKAAIRDLRADIERVLQELAKLQVQLATQYVTWDKLGTELGKKADKAPFTWGWSVVLGLAVLMNMALTAVALLR